MNKKIFLLYLKNQSIDTSFRSVFKEFSWFQKACAVTYFLLCLSIVVLIIIGVFVNETIKYIFIPLILLAIPYLCLSISLKKQKDLSQEIKDRFHLINELTDFLETYGINNKEKVEVFHNRMKDSLDEHLDSIGNTKNAITSVFKVLIIPAFLVILTRLFEDSVNLTEALAYSTLSFIMVGFVYLFIYFTYNIFVDITSGYYEKLKEFLFLLEDVIDYKYSASEKCYSDSQEQIK